MNETTPYPATATTPFYPGLVTARFTDTWNFYTEHLGFKTVVETDTYVHLIHPSGAQLAVLRHELDGPLNLPELVSGVNGRGFWLNLDVEDADAEYRRLVALGTEIVQEPQDRPWGDRALIARDPNGILIFVAHKLSN